ncbi:MAG: hypothetical protein BWY21_01734 [Parcubacteria group bacterium ADurb.Bin216]|nr:MAG: hypothetical protein BWY21_01734 [Parcubacteria group bacterium ADurb.Bin216]
MWTTETSEKFARGFEQYLKEGKAPQSTLQKIFDKFKKWLTDIYNSTKEELVLSDAMRSIYSEMLGVEIPVEAKTETTEAVSSPSGVTPPTEDKVDEKAPKEAPEREKSYFKRVVEGIKPSKALKEAVTKLGLTYRVLSHAETSKDVDYILSELGMEKAEEAVRDLNNGIGAATRMGVMLRIGFHYDRMAEDFRKKGDIEQENYYRDKATALANWKDVTGRDWGRGISYEGSAEFMEQMSPITQVSKTKKEVRSNRDSQLEKERTKEDLSKINKAHKDANAESADELINSEEHKRRKTRTKGITQPKAKSVSKENIQKEGDFQKKKWEELRRAWGDLRKQQKGGTVGFAANAQEEQVVRILGEIFRSKVRQGMYSVEAILEQMAKEFKKFIGEDIDKEVLRGYIPKEIDGKPTEQALAENERQSAAEKLASRITKLLESPKTPKNDPVKQMVETLFGKVKEKGINEKIKFERKSNIERIKEAIENKEQYADVWEKAKKEVDSRIDYNPDLSDEQKQEYRDRLQAFYDEIIGKPYSETNVVGAIKETAKAEEIDIDSVIKQHYTVVDALGRTLAEKIVDATGITGEEAEALAKDIQAQFNKIATAKKRKWLERDIAARVKRATNIKQAKVEAEKLVELTNMGAFSDAEFREIYADAWGFPKLTDTQVKELERLAGEIAKKEGFKRNEAMQDYLNYVAKLPGLDLGEVALTIWYANVLSGMRTQGKNALGSLTNTIGELVTSLVYNMWHGNYSAFAYEFAALWGAKKEAFTEFKYVMKTGYSPVRGNKYETSNTAELWKFTGSWKNPMNYIKYYPGRFMAATDAFFYVGLKEMRAHELAMKEAISRNPNGKPTIMKEDWAKANEILGKTEERVREAVKRATEEGLKGVELKKRIYELMEEGRPQEFIAQSAQFASRGTFNYHPEGAIGSVAEMLSRFTTNYGKISIHNPFTGRTYTMRAAKLLIPFTRIVANVANTAIDYTPIGWLVRARKGYIGTKDEKRFYREYTEEEREKLRIKSLLGTTAMATLFFLSEPPDDPEEEPVITITANGAGKYSRSQQTQDWQPYSIKIGKRWWSYQYTPLFLALAPIGFIRDQQRFGTYKPDEPWLDKVLAPLIFMSSVITDMSAISQAASLLKVVSDKSTQSIDYYIKSTGAGIVKGFIAPKAIEQAKQYYDDIADNPQKYASSFQNNLIKGMPFTKFAVGELPDRYNYWGYPVETDAFQLVARDNSDDFTRFLTRHKIYPEIPDQRSDYCSFFDQEAGIVRQMNDIEYMDFVRTAGSRAKELIEQGLMPQESAMESEDLRKEAKQIGSDTYALVKQEMFGWGEFRSSKDKDGNDNAEKWDILKANRAIQLPVTRPIEWFAEGEGGDMVKQIATEDEMRKYNQVAMEAYANYIIELLSDPDIEDFKKIPDIINGGSLYDTEIKRRWTAAKSDAKVVIVEGRGKAE